MNQPTMQCAQSPQIALLCVASGSDFATQPVAAADLVFGGIHGDLHAGLTRPACARTRWHVRGTPIANTRQISIVSLEECAEIAGLLQIPDVDPGLLGANLVTRGLPDLTTLAAGTRLQFPSGATLFVTEENTPCRCPGAKLAHAHQQPRLEVAFARAAMGRRGLVCLVEREGRIVKDDPIALIVPRAHRRMQVMPVAMLMSGGQPRCSASVRR